MKRQNYYPSRITDQVPWLENLSLKLPGYAVSLTLPTAHVDACVASCKFLVYVLDNWLTAVRLFGPAATSAMDLLCSGSGPGPVELPEFTVPVLPTGVAAVPPGALNRMFDLVQIIKNSVGYTEAIGLDLGIIASAGPATLSVVAQAAPVVKLTAVQGATNQAVKINFHKNGHMGVWIETLTGGAWVFLAIDTEIPYLDDRPLAVAGAPEVRKYRLRYWDKGIANGDWSDVATITVGP